MCHPDSGVCVALLPSALLRRRQKICLKPTRSVASNGTQVENRTTAQVSQLGVLARYTGEGG